MFSACIMTPSNVGEMTTPMNVAPNLASVPESEIAADTSVLNVPNSRTSSEDWSAPRSRRETAYSEDLSAYTVPKNHEPQEIRKTRLCSNFMLTKEQMIKMLESFTDELQRGLVAHKAHPRDWVPEECSFKMLDSCVPTLPTGTEKGVYYALDFGGTNFRAVRVRLDGNGKVGTEQVKYSLKYEGPSGESKGLLDRHATATQLFDHFATRVKLVMNNSGDVTPTSMENRMACGFTFSFPCEQPSLEEAILVEWTKGFETGRNTNDPVEGQEVGRLMKEAFERNQVPARLAAVANDTVGTLLSCAYQKPAGTPDCLIGLIVGTGTNGCYVEADAAQYGYTGKIINIEFGNFNRDLPLTDVDLEIDFHTANRGRQHFEKLISGAYIGETVRLLLVRIFQHRAPPRAWIPETLSCEDAARILSDSSPELLISREVLAGKWCVSWGLDDLRDVKEICRVVFDRSAACSAVAISAMVLKTGKLSSGEGLTIGVDGSVYVKNKFYSHRVKQYLEQLLGEQSQMIYCVRADDGSGKGAAILAATV